MRAREKERVSSEEQRDRGWVVWRGGDGDDVEERGQRERRG